MNVLITGATGFVGGWLTQCLAAKPGYRVLGISRSNQWPNRLEHLVQDVPLELGDRGASGRIHQPGVVIP